MANEIYPPPFYGFDRSTMPTRLDPSRPSTYEYPDAKAEPSEYEPGRVRVQCSGYDNFASLTPARARALAAELLVAADRAEKAASIHPSMFANRCVEAPLNEEGRLCPGCAVPLSVPIASWWDGDPRPCRRCGREPRLPWEKEAEDPPPDAAA